MPFFCDLIGPTILDPEAAEKELLQNPYLVPFSQVLYYESSGKLDQQDYKPLIVAPYGGGAQTKSMTSTVTWGGDTELIGEVNNDAGIREIRNRKDTAQKRVEDIKQFKADAEKKGITNSTAAATVYNFLTNNWLAKLLLDDTQMKNIANTAGELAKWIGYQETAANNELEAAQEKEKTAQRSAGSLVHTGSANNPQMGVLKINEADYHHKVNGVSVTLNNKNDSDYGNLFINKTIVCQQSTVEYANACVQQLYLILSKVAPSWNYEKSKADTPNSNAQTIATITWVAPNNFYMEAKNKDSSQLPDLFSYRGDFQLRKGYDIYRRLVPHTVIVKFSPDKIRIPSQNATDIFKDDADVNVKNNGAALAHNKAMEYWRKLVHPIQGPDTTHSYILFPQWIDIQVQLQPVEPDDPYVCMQKMFCYSDRAVTYESSAVKTDGSTGTTSGTNDSITNGE